MTVASDQSSSPIPLSPTAQRLIALRDEVFDAWEARVRERIAQAHSLQHPILIDTLPVFYDNIAESLTPAHPRSLAVDGTTVANEHGGERARLTSYDYTALIEEYQILRWAIFEVLHRHGVALDHRETHAIHGSVDAGIRGAVGAFSLVHSGFRERFAAALAHDMRNPLSAIVTTIEVMRITSDPARVHALADRLAKHAGRMGGMIDELLDTMAFHGGQSLQLALSDFDIQDVVREVAGEIAGDTAAGARLRIAGDPVPGRWDRAALKRALENLVSNAVKYGDAGTPITVRTQALHGRLVLTVHNEGPPIPLQEQESIFRMYRRAETAKHTGAKGWGIGLPYVRAVAESHGGSMGVDSGIGQGTTFVIDIPIDGALRPDAPTLATDALPGR